MIKFFRKGPFIMQFWNMDDEGVETYTFESKRNCEVFRLVGRISQKQPFLRIADEAFWRELAFANDPKLSRLLGVRLGELRPGHQSS